MERSDNSEEVTEDLLSSFPVFLRNMLSPLIEYPKKSKAGDKMSVHAVKARLFSMLWKSIVKIGHAGDKLYHKKNHILVTH
jgi:hypothetical protein